MGPLPTPARSRIVTVTVAVTAVFVLVDLVGLVAAGPWRLGLIAMSLAMLVVGCGVFLWGFAVAVGRSRTESLALGQIFGLAGNVPSDVRIALFGSIAVEAIVAIVGAAVAPYTSMAFGVLAPMFAIGMTGLWGARYGGGQNTNSKEPTSCLNERVGPS